MRNFKKYRSTVLNLFADFLAGKINQRQLIFNLTQIENKLRQGRNTLKGVWFRFFSGDTIATTIYNIYKDVDCPTNREYIRENMQMAIDNPKQFKIHYS
jgi:hypothetical protein